MNRVFHFLCCIFITLQSTSQSTPYTGGSGSGGASSVSPATVCNLFLGGANDGSSANNSQVTICPPYFGGNGDGYASETKQCNSALPFRYVTFYGHKEERRNILKWDVSDGFEAKEYSIERSSDGRAFTEIGIVPAGINTNFQYLFIDNLPLPIVNFYRIRTTLSGNSVLYSNVIVLRDKLRSSLSIYPNPIVNTATLQYNSEKNAVLVIQLFSVEGKELLRKLVPVIKGANVVSIDVKDIKSGLYFLRINSHNEGLKIVIQK
jgi:hypothetical protein